jgi:hypothetical protein
MSDLLAALNSLRERLNEIPQADARRLQEIKTEILGRKGGAVTEISALPARPEERKRVGGAANALKREFEQAIEARAELKRSASLSDVSHDARPPSMARRGPHRHQIVDEICDGSKSSVSRAWWARKPRPSATTSTR